MKIVARRMIVAVAVAVAVAVGAAACASRPPAVTPSAPRYADLAMPEVPPALLSDSAAVALQQQAWNRLQSGDVKGATRDFTTVLRRAPGFYPAEAGLGDAALASRDYAQAASHFNAALARDAAYMPALSGLVDADLGANDVTGAIDTLRKIVALDPSQQGAKSRLGVLQLRAVEDDMAVGAKARAAGHWADAIAAYRAALDLSPASPAILRALSAVELEQGDLDASESHARADLEALPDAYRAIPTATAVTRAQVAAKLGLDLRPLVDQGQAGRATPVITDVRGHWAAPWILPVARAGLMDVQPNHTFQPSAVVTRADFARIVSRCLAMLAPRHPREAAQWRAARPAFPDLATDHLAYSSAAMAFSAGVMALEEGRFAPSRPLSGPELVAAVARLAQLAAQLP